MNASIYFIMLLAFIYYTYKDFKRSVVLYFIFAFLSPVLIIGPSVRCSFDIIAFPILLFSYLCRSSQLKKCSYTGVLLFGYLFISSLIIAINNVLYGGDFPFIIIYAAIRFIVSVSIIHSAYNGHIVNLMDNVFTFVIPINAIMCILQMSGLIDAQLVSDLYRRSAQGALEMYADTGIIHRAVGTVGSPTVLGVISLFSYIHYFYHFLLNSKTKIPYVLGIMFSVLVGLLALSKIAILGIPLASFMLIVFYYKNINYVRLFLFQLVFFTFCYIIYVVMYESGFYVSYYISYLGNPFEAFYTRYGSGNVDNGSVGMTIDYILKEHFFMGLGTKDTAGLFYKGDSSYAILLYQSGVIGLIAYISAFLYSFFKNLFSFNRLKLVSLLLFFIVASADNLYVSYYFILPAAFILE